MSSISQPKLNCAAGSRASRAGIIIRRNNYYSLYYFTVLVLVLTRPRPRQYPRDQDQDSNPRDQDQDSNPRDQDQDQDTKKVSRDCLETRQCLETSHHWGPP